MVLNPLANRLLAGGRLDDLWTAASQSHRGSNPCLHLEGDQDQVCDLRISPETQP